VQGRFNAVVVTVTKIEPEVSKSIADVATQLRSDVALERAKTQVRDLHDKIEDDRAGGASLEEAAQKEKLPIVTYDAVDRSGRDPSGKPVINAPRGADVIANAFSSDVGVDNDPIDADGGYVWYDVAAIAPAHDRSLDEVKTEAEQRWRDAQIASIVKTKASELLDKLNSGAPFDLVAAAEALSLQNATELKRGATSGGFSAKTTDAVFHTAKDAYNSGAGNDPGQWIVFRVTDIKTPARDPASAGAKQVADTVQKQLADDMMGQYVARMESDFGTTINPTVLAQALGNGAPDTN